MHRLLEKGVDDLWLKPRRKKPVENPSIYRVMIPRAINSPTGGARLVQTTSQQFHSPYYYDCFNNKNNQYYPWTKFVPVNWAKNAEERNDSQGKQKRAGGRH